MGSKVGCSARKQGMPYSKGRAAQYSLTTRIMASKPVLVVMILLLLALSFVCEGLIIQSASASDGAKSSLHQKAKVAADRQRNRVHTILSSRSRFAGAIQADNAEEAIAKARLLKSSNRQRLRRMLARRLQDIADGNCNAVAVAARFRSAQFLRHPAPQRLPITAQPVKALFIICAKKKSGFRAALTSPSRPPVVPFGNNHRRALKHLKQSPPLRVSPLPFTWPPAPPQFRLPPLPFTPTPPRLPAPTLLPPLLPFPLFNIPPLPVQIPEVPCVPSSSGEPLPPP